MFLCNVEASQSFFFVDLHCGGLGLELRIGDKVSDVKVDDFRVDSAELSGLRRLLCCACELKSGGLDVL